MHRSITARFAVRPVARFATTPPRAHEPLLGLARHLRFRAAADRPTLLRRPELGPVALQRSEWRAITAVPDAPAAGRPRRPARSRSLGQARHPRLRSPAARRDGAVARLTRATATSAGGIVIRSFDGVPHLVAGRRRRQRDGVSWTLPKGTPNPHETLEETALREVAEETGLQVRLLAPLEAIEYWFVQGGARIHKTVHFWLMEPVGGDLDRHDHEFDEVRWVPFPEAPALLTFESERALVARAAAVAEPSPGGHA